MMLVLTTAAYKFAVASLVPARAQLPARIGGGASSGDDETTFSPSQPDFPEPPDPYIDAPEFFPAPPRFLEPPPIPPRCEVPPPDEDEDAREPPSRTVTLTSPVTSLPQVPPRAASGLK